MTLQQKDVLMEQSLQKLSALIRWIYDQGWSPATSTNYSLRDAHDSSLCHISKSGIDKSEFGINDFITIGMEGNLLPNSQPGKPSAETDIHLMLYQETDCNVVVHTHSKADTLISRMYATKEEITLENYELLKGLRGIETHEAQTVIPIFKNSQDIKSLSHKIKCYLNNNPNTQGCLIESHGFYTWGRSLKEAKRHLEVFQFLLDCELEIAKINAHRT